MTELTEGAAIPDLKVTPDRYLTVRYAGASGDFNPIHIDEEFAKQVGLPGRILHGLYTMAQVARAQTRGRRRSGEAQAPRRPVPRDGPARAGDHRLGDGARGARRRGRRRHGRRAGRQPDHPQRRSRADRRLSGREARRAPPTIQADMLTPRQELILRKVVDGYRADGHPLGSKSLAQDAEVHLGTVDRALRAGRARGARPARPSAHLRRARADRRRLPLLRRPPAARSPGAAAIARARPRAARDRRGDAGDDRDAVPGHEPAGARVGAADPHLHDPPRRGAGAPAAGGDGGRHHLDRRRQQAPVHLRAARSTPAWPTGPRRTSTSG